MENYRTLSFNTENEALKNKNEIIRYFKERLINSKILTGIDERGNFGFYVNYNLYNN